MKAMPLAMVFVGCWFVMTATPMAAGTMSAHGPAIPVNPILPDGLGVNIHFTDPRPGEMEMMAAAGIRWIRMDFGWGGTEREKGMYDFKAYDRLLAALEPHKVRSIWILDYSNRHYDNGQSPNSDEGRKAFAQWAAAAAKHFQGHGILWEMYNEPNINQFWKPKADVKQYALLALEVGKALPEATPEETYIGPATSTMDFKFLEECFKAGLLEYWAGVSVHPYRQQPPETVAADYARLRKMIDQYAPKDKKIPILSGEWGYSSGWGKFDEEKQGKYLPRQWLVNLACDVPISIWYDWHDDGTDPKEPEHHFGTVHHEFHQGRSPVYDPKPAYEAAKTLTTVLHGLGGYQFEKRLDVGNSEDWVLLFSYGHEKALVAWTTAADERRVVIPPVIPNADTSPVYAYDYTGKQLPWRTEGNKPPALEIAKDGAMTVTLTDAPRYIKRFAK